jgi:hypothetical protein
MSHRDWDLERLREMWEQRAALVRQARSGIAPSSMTRPRRHPFKRRWLDEHADPGPFREADSAPNEDGAASAEWYEEPTGR